jgi:DNA (cytosine-5)-methyltransferase 1
MGMPDDLVERYRRSRSLAKPRLLDLFCGAGGSAMGYARAGFEVVGVDVEPQPNYPFDFHRADALDVLRARICRFDAVHASPPCQSYSVLKGLVGELQDYPKLIAEVRERLQATGLPWVIENVGGARSDLRNPIQLCGSSFGLRVWRHRLFEMSHPPALTPPCAHHLQPAPLDVTGSGGPTLPGRTRTGGGVSRKPKDLADARDAMGIDWMNREELSEAIPPAYCEWIGHELLAHVQQMERAA